MKEICNEIDQNSKLQFGEGFNAVIQLVKNSQNLLSQKVYPICLVVTHAFVVSRKSFKIHTKNMNEFEEFVHLLVINLPFG